MERERPSYFTRLPQALNWVLDQRLRSPDATDVMALRKEVLAFRTGLRAFFTVGSPRRLGHADHEADRTN